MIKGLIANRKANIVKYQNLLIIFCMSISAMTQGKQRNEGEKRWRG
jgi:hypothetical protein